MALQNDHGENIYDFLLELDHIKDLYIIFKLIARISTLTLNRKRSAAQVIAQCELLGMSYATKIVYLRPLLSSKSWVFESDTQGFQLVGSMGKSSTSTTTMYGSAWSRVCVS